MTVDANLARWREASGRQSATDVFVANARQAMPALLEFAGAVLALHAPMDMLHAPTGRVVKVCIACGDDTHETAYPCPTVRIATRTLGGDRS